MIATLQVQGNFARPTNSFSGFLPNFSLAILLTKPWLTCRRLLLHRNAIGSSILSPKHLWYVPFRAVYCFLSAGGSAFSGKPASSHQRSSALKASLPHHEHTAPHKYRDRPRDSASLGLSPGYQRYQKISRMLRQVCESQFFSA
jgi:hypothetical protein